MNPFKERVMMTTTQLDLERMEIIRQLLAIDSREMLDSVKRAIQACLSQGKKEEAQTVSYDRPPCQYTIQELEKILEEAEHQEGIPHEQVVKEMRSKYSCLCR